MPIKFLIGTQQPVSLETITENQVWVIKSKPEVISKDELDIAATITHLAALPGRTLFRDMDIWGTNP